MNHVLSFFDNFFLDLYLEKISGDDHDPCTTRFSSQVFDAVKMTWRLSLTITRVLESNSEGSPSLLSKATFCIHQCDTTNFYNGRNPNYNKVVFYLTNTDTSMLKVCNIYFCLLDIIWKKCRNLTQVRPQLKMAQPPVRLYGARLLNANYIWIFLRELPNKVFGVTIQKIISLMVKKIVQKFKINYSEWDQWATHELFEKVLPIGLTVAHWSHTKGVAHWSH